MLGINVTVLIANAASVPAMAMTTPATEGPTSLAPLNSPELSATALIRSSFPTISITIACRVGCSNAFDTPSTNARMYTCHSSASPVATSTARSNAWTIASARVARMRSRLFTRSAITPAGSTKRVIGKNWRVVTIPNAAFESVSSITSQD